MSQTGVMALQSCIEEELEWITWPVRWHYLSSEQPGFRERQFNCTWLARFHYRISWEIDHAVSGDCFFLDIANHVILSNITKVAVIRSWISLRLMMSGWGVGGRISIHCHTTFLETEPTPGFLCMQMTLLYYTLGNHWRGSQTKYSCMSTIL